MVNAALRGIIVTFFICLFAVRAFAETSLKAQVDKTRLNIGESLTYKLLITSAEKDTPAPRLPKFHGFSVLSQFESSDISLKSGKLKAETAYVFVLSPQHAGKLKIEPAAISINGKSLSSAAFEIEAVAGKADNNTKKHPEQAPLPSEIPSEDDLPEESEITL